MLSVWHDCNILPGEDWEKSIKKELESSDLVLMLVSANSLNAEFIQGEELRTTFDRLREGLARVVPVIVSPCVWRFEPVLAGLQALPLFGSEGPKPVNDRLWQNTDEAWSNVVENLGNKVLKLHEQSQTALAVEAQHERESAQRVKEAETAKEAEQRQTQQQRVESERLAALDAATQQPKDIEAARLRSEQVRLKAEWERE